MMHKDENQPAIIQGALFGAPLSIGPMGRVDKVGLPLVGPDMEPYAPQTNDRVTITMEATMVCAYKDSPDVDTGLYSYEGTWVARPDLATVEITAVVPNTTSKGEAA